MNTLWQQPDLKLVPARRDAAGRTQRLPNAGQPLRVLFHTAPWAMQDPGGGEVQLLKTAEHLCELGVNAKLFDPWTDRLDQADLLHLFGTLPECLTMARRARRSGVPVALSPISWYDPWVSWKLEPDLGGRLRGVASYTARRTCPGLRSWRRELLHSADLLLPNSQAEARQLERLFAVDPSRIAVVPNGVEVRFARGNAELFRLQYDLSDFVLVPGRIEPRKNQLTVLLALWGTGLPVVVLGDPHPDHDAYYQQCLRAADPGVTFLRRLDHDSPLLAAAYAAARVVVLASWFETPGLAALEGALAGAQIVVTEQGSAHEYFGDAAIYVRPNDPGRIRWAVREAFRRPARIGLREKVRASYLWDEVARQTLGAYEHVVGVDTSTLQNTVSRAAA